ncbi:MAG TPA: hypothetical protein DD400_04340 [Rhodospirillaceae bacterium]|nr:hypothetical protein [Rhodospirillaceae bacterium]
MSEINLLFDPFIDFAFMRRALAAAFALSLGGAPLGVFMMLRRMTLVGDALSHALLPGVAIGFLVAGLSLGAMTIGGVCAAFIVGGMAVFLTRFTHLKEDSAFTLLYLLSLGIGVTLISLKGSNTNLLHLLFGNILAIDEATLGLVASISVLSLFTIAIFYRRFVIEGFDSSFLGVVSRGTESWVRQIFFMLLMLNLVAAFQAMGTLMALGLMILPAIASRFWSHNINVLMPMAACLALVSSYTGLLLSFYVSLPSGPAIVLVAGSMGLVSALIGPVGSVRASLKENQQEG